MSIQDINNAAAAQNALTARISSFMDDADAQIAARQAAYDALGSNLQDVVKDQLDFRAQLDPTATNPSNVRGGVFNDLQTLLDAAGSGCSVHISMPDASLYEVDEITLMHPGQTLLITSNIHNRASIRFKSDTYTSGAATYNYINSLRLKPGCSAFLRGIDVLIDGKADPAHGWSSTNSAFFGAWHGSPSIIVGAQHCSFSGADGASIVRPHVSNIVQLGLYACAMDGQIYGIGHVGSGSGIGLHSFYSVAMTNGAQIIDNGSIGSNSLKG